MVGEMYMIHVSDFEENNFIVKCYTCGQKTDKAINIEFNLVEGDFAFTLCKNCAKELVNEVQECLDYRKGI